MQEYRLCNSVLIPAGRASMYYLGKIFSFLAIISGLLICCVQFALAEKPTVKIGMIAPLSGNMSFYGKGWTAAARLAIEELAQTKYQYQLLIEDDYSSPSKAISSFHKLHRIEGVDIIFSASANMALAIAPLAKQTKTIHIGISSDSSFADGQHNFNMWPAPSIPVGSLMEQFKKREIKRVALLGAEHGWPRAVLAMLKDQLIAQKMIVTMYDFFPPEETNFRPQLIKLAKSQSDIAVFLSWPPALELFARQYHELKIKTPLTTDWSFEASQDTSLFNGMWFVSFAPADQAYAAKFEHRFGYRPYAQMELGDVMSKLIVSIYESNGDGTSALSSEILAKSLLKFTTQDSVLGAYSFDGKGVIILPYALKTIQDGKVVVVDPNKDKPDAVEF